jgi:hypothetical protein
METKVLSLKGSVIFLIFFFIHTVVHGDDLENIEINFLPADHSEVNKGMASYQDPLKDIDISYNKIFSYQGNLPIEVQNKAEINVDSLAKGKHKTLYLGPNEFVEIKGMDKRSKLFNGAIIVEFNQVPDLYWFASQNNLQFVSDLSDIKRGVYKIENIYDLEKIIRNLESKIDVKSVELDMVDPSIKIN